MPCSCSSAASCCGVYASSGRSVSGSSPRFCSQPASGGWETAAAGTRAVCTHRSVAWAVASSGLKWPAACAAQPLCCVIPNPKCSTIAQCHTPHPSMDNHTKPTCRIFLAAALRTVQPGAPGSSSACTHHSIYSAATAAGRLAGRLAGWLGQICSMRARGAGQPAGRLTPALANAARVRVRSPQHCRERGKPTAGPASS